MKLNIQAKNMELTPAIREYVEKKTAELGKFLTKAEEKSGEETLAIFEVCKTTHHHKQGEVFRADCSIKVDGKNFFSTSTKEDLYEAIDDVRENLFHEINKFKSRKENLFRRGARSVKKMLKGISKRNPFTGKY